MSEVIQTMDELSDADMTSITESAITLRDTFDMDVNESIRAVDAMITNMGVDAETAFDLIAAGAQNGLNRSRELTDNLTEYSQLWGQAGYRDIKIESDVTTGDRSLTFAYLGTEMAIEPEYYVETEDDEFVVKRKTASSDGFPEYECALNLEELEAKAWTSFSVTDSTIDDAARLALAGTGWTVGECTVTKKRNAGMLKVTSLDVIDLAKQKGLSILAFKVGDTVRLVSASAGVNTKQRIVKLTEYMQAPEKNTCELSNMPSRMS